MCRGETRIELGAHYLVGRLHPFDLGRLLREQDNGLRGDNVQARHGLFERLAVDRSLLGGSQVALQVIAVFCARGVGWGFA